MLDLLLPADLAERLADWLVGDLGGAEHLEDSVGTSLVGGRATASVAGLVALGGLVWAASGLMGSIRIAFRTIWAGAPRRPYVRGKALDLVLALATGIVVVAGFGLSIVTEALAQLGGSLGDALGLTGRRGLARRRNRNRCLARAHVRVLCRPLSIRAARCSADACLADRSSGRCDRVRGRNGRVRVVPRAVRRAQRRVRLARRVARVPARRLCRGRGHAGRSGAVRGLVRYAAGATMSSSSSRPTTVTTSPTSAPASHRASQRSPATATCPTGRHATTTDACLPDQRLGADLHFVSARPAPPVAGLEAAEHETDEERSQSPRRREDDEEPDSEQEEHALRPLSTAAE